MFYHFCKTISNYTNEAQTTSETINLNRYTFANDTKGTPTAHGEKAIVLNLGVEYNWGYDYNANFEELLISNLGNATSPNIDKFKTKAKESHGYYIGRYEARTAVKAERTEANKNNGAQVTVKKDDYVYNYVTQSEATRLSQGMYNTESNFESDLMNSYAWDTAILFMQTFDNRTDKTTPYSRQTSLNTGSMASQGTNNLTEIAKQDKICNVWDIASNSVEWSTEASSCQGLPCINRGGYCFNSSFYAACRDIDTIDNTSINSTFRPLIFM